MPSRQGPGSYSHKQFETVTLALPMDSGARDDLPTETGLSMKSSIFHRPDYRLTVTMMPMAPKITLRLYRLTKISIAMSPAMIPAVTTTRLKWLKMRYLL